MRFPSSVRATGGCLVVNVPKEYHQLIKDNAEEPYSVEVTLRIIYPKRTEPTTAPSA